MHRIKVKIKDGGIVDGKNNIADAIRYLRNGSYAFEIKKWSGEKTWDQIKTVKGVLIRELSEYTGETMKEAERRVKIEYGETETFKKDGETYIDIRSFASYTKDEMRGFIEQLLQHLEHDCGIIIDLDTRKKLTIDTDTGELKEDT